MASRCPSPLSRILVIVWTLIRHPFRSFFILRRSPPPQTQTPVFQLRISQFSCSTSFQSPTVHDLSHLKRKNNRNFSNKRSISFRVLFSNSSSPAILPPPVWSRNDHLGSSVKGYQCQTTQWI